MEKYGLVCYFVAAAQPCLDQFVNGDGKLAFGRVGVFKHGG
jgi:hypothetical protein